MAAARWSRSSTSAAGWALLVAAALLSSACAGGARRAGCGCEPAACAPCATAEPCGPCGPRPPEAKAGEAWCCVWVPPVDGEETTQCLVCPAKERCVWVPPSYATRPKLVCRSPAALTEKLRPAVWAQHERDVLVRPEQERVCGVCCPPGDLAPGERQCGCVTKCVTPPVWGKQCERVCLEPEKRCVGFKPAQYECVEETYEVSPGFFQKVCDPARYESRTRKVCVQPGRWEWRKNDKCQPPPPALQALQLEMIDTTPEGKAAGIFKVGQQARYDVIVTSEPGSAPLLGLKVVFTLPPELEFVSGTAENGVTVTGSGNSAQSGSFDLAMDRDLKLFIIATVKSAPAKESVQVTAVVKNAAGDDLAIETENSTVPK